MKKRTAHDRLFRAHKQAEAEGRGGWLFLIGCVWYINVDWLIAEGSPLIPIAHVVERIKSIEDRTTGLESKYERLAASVRHVARTSTFPPPGNG